MNNITNPSVEGNVYNPESIQENDSKSKNLEQIFITDLEKAGKLQKNLTSRELTAKKINDIKEKIAKYDSKIETQIIKFKATSENIGEMPIRIQKLVGERATLFDSLKELNQSLVTEEYPAQIFGLESQMRGTLEEMPLPMREKYQQLFDEKIQPLLDEAKTIVKARPMNVSIQAAAEKGKALQVATKCMVYLAQNEAVLRDKGISRQKVYLFFEEFRQAVFKKSGERALEESTLVDNLASKMSVETVPTFLFSKSELEHLGISMPLEEQERGHIPSDITPELKQGIESRLSPNDKLLLDESLRTPLTTPNDVKAQQPKIYATPNLKNDSEKNAYEKCEQFRWKYFDQSGKEHTVDFKKLHASKLQNEEINHLHAVDKNGQTVPEQVAPTSEELGLALNVSWKMSSSQLMEVTGEGVDQRISSLGKIEAKPLVQDMLLMSNLDNQERDFVLNRMTVQSQMAAMATSELQLLDLHGENLGIVPVPNQEYQDYKQMNFTIGNDTINFQQLLKEYIKGHIKSDTIIKYQGQASLIKGPLSDLTPLQKALDVQWKIVLFDTDVSLGEDNRLHFANVTKGGKTQKNHLIPLRSVLLETGWKDTPLSEEAIQMLTNSEAQDLSVNQWVSRDDAPIYHRFSERLKDNLKLELIPILEKYSLSEERQQDSQFTLEKLRDRFASDMAAANVTDDQDKLRIWKRIEEELSQLSIYPNDTWESIAKKIHHEDENLKTKEEFEAIISQEVEVLKSLNPNVNLDNIQGGMKIKIQKDLTSKSPEAIEARKQIAKQLFPRLTFRQQNALIERQNSRKEYLHNYQLLKHSTQKEEKLIAQMRGIIMQSTTPLTSLRKEELLDLLIVKRELYLKDPDELNQFKDALLNECQPTYFNITKSMYPLLADTYALNEELFANNKQVPSIGITIGHPGGSLDASVQTGLRRGLNTTAGRLATRLKEEIDSTQNTAFFDSISF